MDESSSTRGLRPLENSLLIIQIDSSGSAADPSYLESSLIEGALPPSYPECPICLEDISHKEVVTVPCCKKQFDLECYLKCGSRCPMCRADKLTSVTVEEPPRVTTTTTTIVYEVPNRKVQALQFVFTCVLFGILFGPWFMR